MCFFCYVLTGQLTRVRMVAIVAASLISAAGQMFIIFAHVVLAYGLASGLLVVVRKGVSVRVATSLTLASVLCGRVRIVSRGYHRRLDPGRFPKPWDHRHIQNRQGRTHVHRPGGRHDGQAGWNAASRCDTARESRCVQAGCDGRPRKYMLRRSVEHTRRSFVCSLTRTS